MIYIRFLHFPPEFLKVRRGTVSPPTRSGRLLMGGGSHNGGGGHIMGFN